MVERDFEYDVGLSFAGERREYVSQVANQLKFHGIRVFFDDYEQEALWGKDLYAYLSEIYHHMCRFCVIFVSKDYAAKVWPTRELQSAQARALEEKQEYILPARFDDTRIPGLLDTVHYIDLRQTSPSDLSDLIVKKLGKDVRRNYLPPTLDRLFERLGIEDDEEMQAHADSQAKSFFQVLRRMDPDERDAVVSLLRFGCPEDLPENVHIDTDLLRRHTGKSVARLKSLLGGVRSMGFQCSIREGSEAKDNMQGEVLGDAYSFYLSWWHLSDQGVFPALAVATAMIDVTTDGYCEEHGAKYLERLDFSQLASATASKEAHESDE